eukprot:6183748-Pleurochrysis_carterae.AAC.2
MACSERWHKRCETHKRSETGNIAIQELALIFQPHDDLHYAPSMHTTRQAGWRRVTNSSNHLMSAANGTKLSIAVNIGRRSQKCASHGAKRYTDRDLKMIDKRMSQFPTRQHAGAKPTASLIPALPVCGTDTFLKIKS